MINQPIPSSNSYSAAIRYHISNGTPKEALLLYTQIRRNPLCMLTIAPLILKACASLSMIHYGKAVHCESIKAGVASDVVVGTSTVSMYGKCCDVINARKMFDEMPVKNVVTWNAVISSYMRDGATETALCLFEKMSDRTAVSWIEMIAGYAKVLDTEMARCLFDQVPLSLKNVVTWSVMVDGYASNGQMKAAKDMFEVMPGRSFYVWSSMVSGYFKKGDVEEGKAIFDRIKVRNLVHWNSLISGYCQNGLCKEALDAFAKMQSDGFEPDEVSFASALSACAQLGLLETGKELHSMIIQKRIKVNQFILNGLVDMYAKCGDLTSARLIFDNGSEIERNDSCWNAMISGFSIHGYCREALEFFNKMEKSSVNPDEITFLSVLSACAHAGFVEDGLTAFKKLAKYGLSANVKHYGCLIDLLGRAGRLVEAYRIVTKMPMRPNDTIWGALLGACTVHSDLIMANRVLERIKLQDSCDSSCYVLMSNIYAASDRWEKAESLRIAMSSKRVVKTIGHSSVTLNTT
ncbi:putative tetratricopeptide-like helical domain superfamily [Helianthus annuus]|nr:putative tetratricopeptide-like helical domain superfamily [Helianthus annuus]